MCCADRAVPGTLQQERCNKGFCLDSSLAWQSEKSHEARVPGMASDLGAAEVFARPAGTAGRRRPITRPDVAHHLLRRAGRSFAGSRTFRQFRAWTRDGRRRLGALCFRKVAIHLAKDEPRSAIERIDQHHRDRRRLGCTAEQPPGRIVARASTILGFASWQGMPERSRIPCRWSISPERWRRARPRAARSRAPGPR